MGKKVVLLVLLSLAFLTSAFATSQIDLTNSGGTLAGIDGGLSLSNSTVIAINGLSGGGLITGSNLGNLAFSTGALTSGSLQLGATFATGGSFIISGNGNNGIPGGAIFTGVFSAPVTWTLVTLPNGTHNYTLTGIVSGTFPSGYQANGVSVQLTINTGKGFFNGLTQVSSGDTNIVVPEPGTMSLLGTGLVSLGGILRRKLRVPV
jgi:hypothetical protein